MWLEGGEEAAEVLLEELVAGIQANRGDDGSEEAC